jgi:hypothetical protein
MKNVLIWKIQGMSMEKVTNNVQMNFWSTLVLALNSLNILTTRTKIHAKRRINEWKNKIEVRGQKKKQTKSVSSMILKVVLAKGKKLTIN